MSPFFFSVPFVVLFFCFQIKSAFQLHISALLQGPVLHFRVHLSPNLVIVHPQKFMILFYRTLYLVVQCSIIISLDRMKQPFLLMYAVRLRARDQKNRRTGIAAFLKTFSFNTFLIALIALDPSSQKEISSRRTDTAVRFPENAMRYAPSLL